MDRCWNRAADAIVVDKKDTDGMVRRLAPAMYPGTRCSLMLAGYTGFSAPSRWADIETRTVER